MVPGAWGRGSEGEQGIGWDLDVGCVLPPVPPRRWSRRALLGLGLFWAGIWKLNAAHCAGRLAGKLSMATRPIHKAPYGFLGGGGSELSREVNLCCLFCSASLCKWSRGRWKRGALPPGHGFCSAKVPSGTSQRASPCSQRWSSL